MNTTHFADPVPLDRLTPWLRRAAEDVTIGDDPLELVAVSGGYSNLTFRIVDAAGRAFALRRPPMGGVLATAHDMRREWRFITALAGSGVPVPGAVAYCEDPSVIGAEFYLMDYVDGVVPTDVERGERIPGGRRHRAGLHCAEVLAALHAVDPARIGLADLRRPGSFVERQLARWHRQAHKSAVPDLGLLDAAHAALVAAAPSTERSAIAHGDFRPGNMAFTADGEIAAVFDWELATFGDPLADLGYLVASWGRPGDRFPEITSGPTSADGWPDREEIVAHYAALSGRGDEIHESLTFFEAFARWRIACIAAGVYTRFKAGQMSSSPEVERAALTRLEKVGTQSAAALEILRSR